MVKVVLFAFLVFTLGFITLYSSALSEAKWFKIGISGIFSALVTMLVTFNIFR